MACEFEPPKPKEFTDARRRPGSGQGTFSTGNYPLVSGSFAYFDAMHYLQIPVLKRNSRVDVLKSNVPWDDAFLED
jgi:hypothetical protein